MKARMIVRKIGHICTIFVWKGRQKWGSYWVRVGQQFPICWYKVGKLWEYGNFWALCIWTIKKNTSIQTKWGNFEWAGVLSGDWKVGRRKTVARQSLLWEEPVGNQPLFLKDSHFLENLTTPYFSSVCCPKDLCPYYLHHYHHKNTTINMINIISTIGMIIIIIMLLVWMDPRARSTSPFLAAFRPWQPSNIIAIAIIASVRHWQFLRCLIP